ncbi:MAG: ZPR1 zinc finger domain-containing protein [Candidatus Lokiarchaeota archaeon]|nr:ZPR1 zinc finger domain-containing protein [Candidatus Lokiarchaeota archaeon]
MSNEENKTEYELPDITEKIHCPICKDGIIKINRTIHRLPDGEDILILLMECSNCSYQNRDVITLQTAFKPGQWILNVEDGDLSAKIFRSPEGTISIPEADMEIEPGSHANYMITTIEGILERMIKWAEYFYKSLEDDEDKTIDERRKKVEKTIEILKMCKAGTQKFKVVLTDKTGGSYITTTSKNEKTLVFEEETE